MKRFDPQRCRCSRSARILKFVIATELAAISQVAAQAQDRRPLVQSTDGAAVEDLPAQPAGQPLDTSLLPRGELSDQHWEFVSRAKPALLAETWLIQQFDGEAVLVCRGEPYGYLKTTKAFGDFQLKIEWKFPFDENGNSGILLYTNGQEKDQVWPTAMQVQLHQPVCGSIFRSGEAQSDNEIRDVRDVCKAVNQWNFCEITSVAGRLSVQMNGKELGVVTGCRPSSGGIALQSEGSEVHFRRIWIKELAQGDDRGPSVSDAHLRRSSRRTQVGPFVPFPIPGRVTARADFVGGVSGPPGASGMHTHVVYRDRLAADDHPVRTRRRERMVVGSHAEVPLSDRGPAVRRGHRRELRR